AAPRKNVVRAKPQDGDLVLLIGGRTGRDGCGGATGSSKAHTENSLTECGAEVQKGNPITERKLQRLFRNPEVSRLIKKCNDFGAGGVSVAVGELAPGLLINLDNIPKKYEGLDGTELAISESQERMAVIIAPDSIDKFSKAIKEENLEFSIIGKVQEKRRLQMVWRNKMIVDISRDFIDTNGVQRKTTVKIKKPEVNNNYFSDNNIILDKEDIKKRWIESVSSLNTCSQQGLIEMFDSTIGAGTVLLPFGGLYQKTPIQTMAAKLPILRGETTTGTLMSYGYNPQLSKWSPFHGAIFAIVEAVSKIVAYGGDPKKIRLSLQEYFEKVGNDPEKWGKPFAALLGAYLAQIKMKIPSIGGKDSMSGTFKDLNVPPTLVAFAVAPVDIRDIISPEFKEEDSSVVFLKVIRDKNEIPDFEYFDKMLSKIKNGILQKDIISAYVVGCGGCAEAITKMCWGNKIGIKIDEKIEPELLFTKDICSFVLEIKKGATIESLFEGLCYYLIGKTIKKPEIEIADISISLTELLKASESVLSSVFPIYPPKEDLNLKIPYYTTKTDKKSSITIAKPRVLITVFPGTNCEYDTIKAFTKAGALCQEFVAKNLSPSEIEESIELMVKIVKNSQIIMIPGGFSAGDEPDGSGKFIAAFFRNPKIKESISEFLEKRDGLMLGICNGFQALIKLGLVPYGKILDMETTSPTLTFNTLGRHISKMVYTEIVSVKSPWLSKVKVGDIHVIPISHGEGRFIASKETIDKLIKNGQIATRYTEYPYGGYYFSDTNPNGSMFAIEGITSPDGRILGKMGHSERTGRYVGKNIYGEKDQHIFEAGVDYFR
ncbi:MAG: phosphoribosylformylglycinamidine synthase, partial [Chitinispirillaceae bacterium]|nr:phosphoribosylformylglycinamidine synthase [Chitinispirillaceae bacterium]